MVPGVRAPDFNVVVSGASPCGGDTPTLFQSDVLGSLSRRQLSQG